MSERKHPTPGDAALRERAEKALRKSRREIAAMPREGIQALVHELQLHQMELEIQNEELRTRQLQLEEARNRYLDLYDFSPVGYLTVDHKGVIQEANLTVATILGTDRAPLIGRSLLGFVAAAQKATMNDYVTRALQPGTRETIEIRMVRPDHTCFHARLDAIPEPDTDGLIARCRISLADATARRAVEQELESHRNHLEELVDQRTHERDESRGALHRAERLASIGTLATGIAHEINNPIGMIRLTAENARAQLQQPDAVRVADAALSEIIDQTHRCGRIVKGILQFSRQERTEKWPNPISPIIHRAVQLASGVIEQHHASVEVEVGDDLPELILNPTQIEQALVNLISNAVQSRDTNTRVTIRGESTSSGVQVAVEDNGRGIPPEQKGHLFAPFHTTRRAKGGTGLGLSIVHGVIAEHGGTIEVHSEPDRGTRFVLHLPYTGGAVP